MNAFILSHFDKITIVIFVTFGLFAFYILRRNHKLDLENRELKQAISGATQILTIQNKVIDAAQDTQPTDFNGLLDRLHQNKL